MSAPSPTSMPAAYPPPPRWLVALVAMVLGAYLGWALYLSIVDILRYDDFEVYHYIGGVAAQRGSNIYELTTPHQQRGPFLYPVSAAALFVPLSWLAHDVAGVLFAIVKVACLALLWWGSVRFAGRKPIDALAFILPMLAAVIMLHRGLASDIGNGQINLLVAVAAVGGLWLIMVGRRAWWIGSLTLAWAIAIKLTPALLLAALVVNRRWKALTLTMIASGLLLIALPVAWFGPEGYRKMNAQYREIAARFTFDWASPHEQTTPTELFQFARLQRGDAMTTPADAPEALPVPISGYAGERLFEPRFRPPAMRFWFITGVCAGAAYLAFRWLVLLPRWPRGRADWTWDLAMLCGLMVFLSPRVQKAHLVILLVPAIWLSARIGSWFAPAAFVRQPFKPIIASVAYGLICAMFLVGDTLKIEIPGWDEPARFMPLIGLISLLIMTAIVGWIDAPHDSSTAVEGLPPQGDMLAGQAS